MNVGQYQSLEIDRITDPGAYLTDGESDILLPTKFIPKDAKRGDVLSVFVYRDSEDRLICTTQRPYALVDEFAYLKVKDANNIGAFLDWGIDKDLLIPFSEQKNKLKKGQWCLVRILLDEKTDRPIATAKVARFFSEEVSVVEGEMVQLLVAGTTDLGVNVVVNNQYKGLIFENDLFHDLLEGDRIRGFVKKIREDGKLDISLRKVGMENLEEGARYILSELEMNDGHLALTDKSSPEDIQSVLQMSKKNFKRSVGILYRKGVVQLLPRGIFLKKES